MPSLESLLGLAEPEEGAMSIGDLLGFGEDQTGKPHVPGDVGEMLRGGLGFDPNVYGYDFNPLHPGTRVWGPQRTPVPANDISASDAGSKYGGQTTSMQPQFSDFSDLAQLLSNYRWRAGGHDTQAIPEQYSGDIPPTLLPDFMKMVRDGLPPSVAHSILTQPSYAEAENSGQGYGMSWPYDYRGQEQEARAQQQQQMSPPLRAPGAIDPMQGMNDRLVNKRLNLPTWEGHTPGEDDSLGYYRLPNGQYVPQLSPDHRDPLQYYRQRGNPNSFYWNPPQGYFPPWYNYGDQ